MATEGERATTAIDLGGTKIAAARVQGARILERRQAPTPQTGRFDDVLETIVDLANGWADGPVALASTGLVECGCLTAINTETLDAPPRVPIEKRLGAWLGVPVHAINDAQAAAWGEFRFGAGRGCNSMLFVTLSTGVGGGLVLDNALRSGRGGLGGHVGHMVVDPRGPLCGCGRRGCLEAIASGRALARLAASRLGRPMTSERLFDAALSDAAAAQLLNDAAESVASLLCSLQAALELDCAVIGGGVGLASGFLPRIAAAMSKMPRRLRLDLRPAALGADAGLIGAAEWSAAKGAANPQVSG